MELKIGDKIKRFQLSTEFETVYEIDSVTKTLAKSNEKSKVFSRKITVNSSLHNENYIGEVQIISSYGTKIKKGNSRYFVLKP
jgi:hypothetical protein